MGQLALPPVPMISDYELRVTNHGRNHRSLITGSESPLDSRISLLALGTSRPTPSASSLVFGFSAQRQNSNARPEFVNHNKGSGFKFGLVPVQGLDGKFPKTIRHQVLCPNLKYAGRMRLGRSKNRAEIKIVGEKNVFVIPRIRQNRGIGSAWISNIRPMQAFPTLILQNLAPLG